MHVVATAGHVDHGKSTLVRALTGMEPDRWAEERRRGLTLDLGFAWTTLPSGRDVAFVDVPGHERFLGNMLAGLGPTPVVMFVVAVDEGWRAQSSDHREAVAALGIDRGVLVLTRADRGTPERAAETLTQARIELADTGLHDAPAVTVSALTGSGIGELRDVLDAVLGSQVIPPPTGRIRLWVDRSFSVTGAGTIVTGTLASGRVGLGDTLHLLGRSGSTEVTVRGIESEQVRREFVEPVSRVALNLRGVAPSHVRRGDALVTPGQWASTSVVDVRRISGLSFTDDPNHVSVHVGTAAVPGRLRPFDEDHARITLTRALPLSVADRLVLRDPGRRILGGAQVLDAEPASLQRRGDAARQLSRLAALRTDGDLAVEVARRGAVREDHLRRLGLLPDGGAGPPHGIRIDHGWWLDAAASRAWSQRLHAAATDLHARDPLAIGLSRGAAAELLGLPDDRLVDALASDAGLELADGFLRVPGAGSGLGDAEPAVAELERLLTEHPFDAPEADALAHLELGARELAAAERQGRLLRLADGIVLAPTAPALAMRRLAALDQPFTTSQARQALNSTRRVVIPLLEHLDKRGWTRRIDAGHREVRRPKGSVEGGSRPN